MVRVVDEDALDHPPAAVLSTLAPLAMTDHLVEPFESVAERMRQSSSERAFDEEVAKWLKDLRQKSRISIYRIPAEIPRDRKAIVFQAAPSPTPAPLCFNCLASC